MGTDENRLFKALQGRTPMQIAAMRKAYVSFYDRVEHGRRRPERHEFSEEDRAKAMLSGDPVASAAATLQDAMWGAGTDEKLVMETLRGKTPAEHDAIMDKYKEMYGVDAP